MLEMDLRQAPIQNLLALVAVAEGGQLRAAAQRLNITESAVSHQISRLEAQVGCRLVTRGPKGAALTEAGRRFHARIAPALAQIDAALAELAPGPATPIRLTMPNSFAALCYAPRLHRLAEDLPDVEIEIIPTPRLCDLAAERIDLAIRHVPDTLPSPVATRLVREYLFPICTPDVAAMIGGIGWDGFLARGYTIANELHPGEWNLWCDAFAMTRPARERQRMLSGFDVVSNALAGGPCLALGRTPMVDADLRSGRLVAPFGGDRLPLGWYYLAVNPATPLRGTRRRVHDWLMAQFGAGTIS